MGKYLSLMLQKTRTLIKGSPLVFTVYVIVQLVTCFSYVFFYSTVVKSRIDYISAYDSMRRITVSLPSGQTMPGGLVKRLTQNGVAEPEQIDFYFYADDSKNPKKLWAFLYPQKENGTVTGRGISKDEIDKKALVIIPANEDVRLDPDPSHHEKHKIGDSVKIGGETYSAIGVRYGGDFDEIPYTTGLERYGIYQLDFLMPPGLTDAQKEQAGNYYQNLLDAVSVALPKPMAERVFANLFFPFAASVFIGVIAILNFIFLYRFMLEKNQRVFVLLRICGCSRRKSLLLLYGQMLLLFTASYLVSTAAFFVMKAVGGLFSSASFDLPGCGIIYLTFVLIITFLILPFALRFFKKSLISDEKLLA